MRAGQDATERLHYGVGSFIASYHLQYCLVYVKRCLLSCIYFRPCRACRCRQGPLISMTRYTPSVLWTSASQMPDSTIPRLLLTSLLFILGHTRLLTRDTHLNPTTRRYSPVLKESCAQAAQDGSQVSGIMHGRAPCGPSDSLVSAGDCQEHNAAPQYVPASSHLISIRGFDIFSISTPYFLFHLQVG